MIITRPMFTLSQDQGGAIGGTRTDGGAAPGKTTPDSSGGLAGKDPQDKGGTGSKTTDSVPDDPAQLKAILAQERAEKEHLLKTHLEMKSKAEERSTAEEKARQENLKKQGEFEKLLAEQTPKFEALSAQVKRQDAVLASYLEQELKAVPESMKAIMPPEGDILARLEWITKAKAAGLMGGQKPAVPGKAPDGTPPPANGNSASITRAALNAMNPQERHKAMLAGVKVVD